MYGTHACIVYVNQLITKEMFSGYDAGILTSYFSLLLRLPYPSEGCQLPIKNIHSLPRQGAHLSANNTMTCYEQHNRHLLVLATVS